ncbi:MAG: hypothetical protein KAG66_21425, partial [Methylococcales bacterium]|nr:hypothetical protein [Methylococcales bacterium]
QTMTKSHDQTPSPLILSLDVGTLSVRAALYNKNGNLQTLTSKPIHLNRISDTEVEQNPLEIKTALFDVLNQTLNCPIAKNHPITTSGLTTQRSSVVAWNKHTGHPLSPILSWQDRRAAHYLKPLTSHATTIKAKSGLFLTPHYGASKLRWLLDHCPPLSTAQTENNLIFGPLAAFIIHARTKNHACLVDHVNASRTQLMDIQTKDWSPSLLKNFNLSQTHLPTCQPTQSHYGTIKGTDIPLTAVNGDQNAAIHGLGQLETGTFIVNIGTGAFILLPTGERPVHHPRLLTSIANSNEQTTTYLLEGTVNGAGSAINWASKQWDIPDLITPLPQWLTEVQNPPLFINTIGGLGSPIWKEGNPPHFVGDGSIAEKSVAIIESIIFLIKINLEAMTNTGQEAKRIRISGGLSALDGLCQLLADLSQRPVIRSESQQSTARGIAWLAARPTEKWDNANNDYFLPKTNRALQSRYRTFCSHLGWS